MKYTRIKTSYLTYDFEYNTQIFNPILIFKVIKNEWTIPRNKSQNEYIIKRNLVRYTIWSNEINEVNQITIGESKLQRSGGNVK